MKENAWMQIFDEKRMDGCMQRKPSSSWLKQKLSSSWMKTGWIDATDSPTTL
jgi:hypothetical protein